ncbi:MAG: aspartate--tRNA(Asn) ligase [Candidatus Micrarchaeia archaeon]
MVMRTHYAKEVTPETKGEITVAGWVHEIRDMGKLKFIILRDRTGLLQITAKAGVVSEEILNKIDFVKETVIQVKGRVVAEKQAMGGRELIPNEINVLGRVTERIPFEVTGKVPADLDVRLDNRHIDLRRIETQAIFRIKSEILRAFREKLISLGFQEIVPPCIVAAATEGGSNLFPVVYFEREAFLAQSPQLYKQMAVVGGMDKVFMTIPAFRAEKHNTTTHLNEVLQMDIEMGFADHNDVMDVLSAVLIHILKCVKERCSDDLDAINMKITVPEEIKRHTYTELVELLNKHGYEMAWGEDFTREHERKLQEILGEEAYLITEWPTNVRAFYSMPKDGNKKVCNAFDMMYRGVEIASGAQRIHIPELLVEQLLARGLDPENFEFYVRTFRMGAPPHAGWSIGLERIAMMICGVKNIREVAMFPRDRTRLTP